MRLSIKHVLFSTCAVIFLFSGLNAASTTIYPVEDAYVDSTATTVNHGTETGISLLNFMGTNLYGFIKFNSAEIPAGTINNATLYINAFYSMGSPTAAAQNCSAAWDENTVTYGNMPGVSGPVSTVQLFDSIVPAYYSMDITSIVSAWQAGPNNGLRLSLTTPMVAAIMAREAGPGAWPYLVIDYTPPAGTPTFTHTINQSITATDTRTITATRTTTPTYSITPTVTAGISVPEAVDNLGLTFTFSGNLPWYGQTTTTYSGGDSARSGPITNSQLSTMETTLAGPGTITFWWTVSSESGWDYLRFYVDGIQQGSISGMPAWAFVTYTVGAGNHTFRWTYSKDGSISSGTDSGYVDLITFGYASPTYTSTVTSTRTITQTHTISSTHTISPTHSHTRTITETRTVTQTRTITQTSTISQTHTASPTVTSTRTVTATPTGTGTPVYAAFPYFDGFESGGFLPYWQTYYSFPDGLIDVSTLNIPYAGSYHARLQGNTTYTLREITLHINLAGAVNPYLRFYVKEFDEDPQAMAATYTGHYNGDGVSISGDGVNWYTLVSLTGAYAAYTVFDMPLDAAITAAGIADRSTIRIRFQEYEDFAIPTDGLVFDNIELYSPGSATPTPTRSSTYTVTPTHSISPTYTISNTHTVSPTFTATRTITETRTITPSWTTSNTHTVSPTASATRTITPTSTATGTPVYAPFPYFDGLETGGFNQYWQFYGSNSYSRIRFSTSYASYAGSYYLAMDSNVDGNYALNEAILHVNLSGATLPRLRFYVIDYGDENEALPVSYAGHYNADGVSISGDGVNWYRLVSLLDYGTFNLLDFDLDAAITAAGIADRSRIRIKFQQYDNFGIGTDGIGFDNIELYTLSVVTSTRTATVTRTASPTGTDTATRTATRTITETHTITPTFTITNTHTVSPTITPTSVFQQALPDNSYIYPQPADDYARVVFSSAAAGTAEVFIYNLAGMLVAKETGAMAVSSINFMDLDLSLFAPGVYLYILKTESTSGLKIDHAAKKFMVK